MKIDIGRVGKYPSEQLSNFNKMSFEIDGIKCVSMEGFLQSLKFKDIEKQKEICQLWGGNAKKKGSKRNKKWKTEQKLNWMGKEYRRESEEYTQLIRKAYTEIVKNKEYQKLILDTGLKKLVHSYGRNEKTETVLTEKEFCDELEYWREKIRKRKIEELMESVKEEREKIIDILKNAEYLPDEIKNGKEEILFVYIKKEKEMIQKINKNSKINEEVRLFFKEEEYDLHS